MNIVKSCRETKPTPTPTTVKFNDIPIGMVFRYGDHKCGPYLKISIGEYCVLGYGSGVYRGEAHTTFPNYKPLPNALLVTGEDE